MKHFIYILVLLHIPLFSQINWQNVGPGANGQISDIATDSSGVYFVGNFTEIGGIQANSIAKWNGAGWETFGGGLDFSVNAILLWKNQIFAGGTFTIAGGQEANGIARWDGAQWNAMGSGLAASGGNIHTLAADDSNLYAGGFFNEISGITAYSVARWDGNRWFPMGRGFQAEQINSLVVYKNQVYAGGTFIIPSENLAHIARWEDTSWVSLNGGANLPVTSMAVYNDTLYLAGQFTQVGNLTGGGGLPAKRVARWDGNNWSTVGSGLNGIPYGLTVRNGYVYCVGNFSGANPPFKVIYKWDGINWVNLAESNGFFRAIGFSEQDRTFYVGGSFSNVSTLGTANNIVKFTDSSAVVSSLIKIPDSSDKARFYLYQNFPNPFGLSSGSAEADTKILFTIAEDGYTSLRIFDILGHQKAMLVSGVLKAGELHSIRFSGADLSSGVYFCKLESNGNTMVKKIVFLK